MRESGGMGEENEQASVRERERVHRKREKGVMKERKVEERRARETCERRGG